MKVKMLRSAAASFGCKLKEGESGNVKKDLAERLIASGLAVSLEESNVAVEPEVAVAPVASEPEPTIEPDKELTDG